MDFFVSVFFALVYHDGNELHPGKHGKDCTFVKMLIADLNQLWLLQDENGKF